MDNGEQYPFISQKSVHAALDTLLYTSSAPKANPLQRLLIVDVFLANPDLPQGPDIREFALHQILISMVTENYYHLRSVLGLPASIETNTSFNTALTELTSDVRRGNNELVGWSLLYHRYVRTDLDISLDLLSKLLHLDQRTLRRYQQFTIGQLTEKLMIAEWTARIEQRKRRLIIELPLIVPVSLIGRADFFARATAILNDPPPHHIQVTGAAGIGKTVFVQEVIRGQILDEQFEHLVWIYRPETVGYVRRYLSEHLLPASSTIDLREYTLMHRVAVVLDDAELLYQEHEALEVLLDYLDAALVFCISRLYTPLRNSIEHIVLTELSESDSIRMAQSRTGINARNEASLSADFANSIREVSGGNPLAIKLITQYPLAHRIDPHILNDLFLHIYSHMNFRLKRAWFMFALLPPGNVDLSKLSTLWPMWIDKSDMAFLIHHHLVEQQDDQATAGVLMTSARRFIQNQYECEAEAHSLIDDLFSNLEVHSSEIAIIDVIEHVLLSNWLDIDPENVRLWTDTFGQAGIRVGHWSNWCKIFETHFLKMGATINLQMEYGICLRYLSEWRRAENVFREVILETGLNGDFLNQSRALLELGVLFRYQGYYERTLAILRQIEDLLKRIPDDSLLDDLKMEYAQLTIDRGDGEGALLYYLEDIQHESIRHMLLRSEALLLVGKLKQSRELAYRAVDEATVSYRQAEARAYHILGCGYEQQGKLRTALDNFGLAVTILEQANDPFALARAQVNLAAVLIRLGDYEEAHSLLKRAGEIQSRLGDRPSLVATQHNLHILQILTSKMP